MDLVEQLRYYANDMKPSGLGGQGYSLSPHKAPLLEQAAAEITRLRAEVERLRTALEALEDHWAGLSSEQRKIVAIALGRIRPDCAALAPDGKDGE